MNTSSIQAKLETFFSDCDSLAELISSQETALVALLSGYETHEAAEDEIMRSLDALQGVRAEMTAIQTPLQELNIATIFPLNLPLYSLVIFGIIPSVFANKAFIRPPEIMQSLLTQLWEILHIDERFPNVHLNPVPRQVFVQLYASECDVIIFTGKYKNALAIHEQCPDALLIYNGSGVNPFIIFENADINLAAEKAVEMRCFNSGQDCAGPDAFLIPTTLADAFIQKLETLLEDIQVGATTNPSVRVGPTMKQSYISELEDWLKDKQPNIVFGGKIDKEKHLVYPTIVRKNITLLTDFSFHEFFAPYFYVLTYDTLEDLQKVLNSSSFKERGMYASVFGDNPAIEKTLDSVKILKNVIVNDVERGNNEYGGYGEYANFLQYHDEKVVHPLLISRDIHEMLATEEQL
ncbi:MAG TPA: aldehyde dehydrogenase family protein [Patescibacteria group bacterium]|nr:aldehyde dehydrogenase family protein [Patescibacteria group bacterium]